MPDPDLAPIHHLGLAPVHLAGGPPQAGLIGEAHASLLLVWLDRGFAGDDPAHFLRGYGISSELVGTVGRKGFQIEPRRWKVEQTFGCLQRYRRLRVDDEMSHDTSRQMTVLASLFLIGMRLQRMLQP